MMYYEIPKIYNSKHKVYYCYWQYDFPFYVALFVQACYLQYLQEAPNLFRCLSLKFENIGADVSARSHSLSLLG